MINQSPMIKFFRKIRQNSTIGNKESRKEFKRLFYERDFTNFWFWKADEEPFRYAKVFFRDLDSPSYRKLKQNAGWSIAIYDGLLKNNKMLYRMSRPLNCSINKELEKVIN